MYNITPKEAPPATPTQTLEQVIRQPDTNEGTQGSAPEAPPSAQADPLGPKFALLAKREKALRSREEQLKAMEQALKAKDVEYQSSYIPKSGLKAAALEALQRGELSYDEITQQMLSQPAAQVDPVIREQQAKIAELEKKLSELDGTFKQKQTNEYQQAITQLGHDVQSELAGNSEFEMINELKMHSKVVDLIKDTFESDGRLMSIAEAAKEIEDYLTEEALKVTSIGKVKAKLTPQPEQGKPEMKQQPNQQQQMKTLTNAVTTSKPMTPRERAMLAFEGKLN